MLDLQDIKTISLVDNNTSKEIINFKKTDMGKIAEFKYRELSTTGNLASSIASTAVMDSMLKIANPNGFFTATVNPSTLMEYTKGVGGLSSIVQGSNGKIISHSGFVNASVFTPIVAFQILSFATGQYYLHGINKQLSKILNKLDDLQFFIESEDLAKINVIQEELLNLSNKEIVTQQDFNTISNFKTELKFIKEKYKINIQKEIGEIQNENNISKLFEKKNKIEKYSNVFYDSQQLLFYIEQIELNFYIKNKKFENINDIYDRIQNYNIEQISFDDISKKIEKLENPRNNNSMHKLCFRFDYLINKKLKKKYNSFETDINNARRDLNNKWNESQEVLCYIDENNNQRMFIKDTSNNCKDIEEDETIDMIL